MPRDRAFPEMEQCYAKWKSARQFQHVPALCVQQMGDLMRLEVEPVCNDQKPLKSRAGSRFAHSR
jgi:hypothetical protein